MPWSQIIDRYVQRLTADLNYTLVDADLFHLWHQDLQQSHDGLQWQLLFPWLNLHSHQWHSHHRPQHTSHRSYTLHTRAQYEYNSVTDTSQISQGFGAPKIIKIDSFLLELFKNNKGFAFSESECMNQCLNNNNNKNHDNVDAAVIMTIIARVHPVHLINVSCAPGGCQPSDQASRLGL